MTLHDRARKLAEKLTEGEWDGPSPDDIAAAMASLARDFAREAIREMFTTERPYVDRVDLMLRIPGLVSYTGYPPGLRPIVSLASDTDARLAVDGAIEAAIAAAEKGSTDDK